jgi:hypothetical protein
VETRFEKREVIKPRRWKSNNKMNNGEFECSSTEVVPDLFNEGYGVCCV